MAREPETSGPDLDAIQTRLAVAKARLEEVMAQRRAALDRLAAIQAERAAAEQAARES